MASLLIVGNCEWSCDEPRLKLKGLSPSSCTSSYLLLNQTQANKLSSRLITAWSTIYENWPISSSIYILDSWESSSQSPRFVGLRQARSSLTSGSLFSHLNVFLAPFVKLLRQQLMMTRASSQVKSIHHDFLWLDLCMKMSSAESWWTQTKNSAKEASLAMMKTT